MCFTLNLCKVTTFGVYIVSMCVSSILHFPQLLSVAKGWRQKSFQTQVRQFSTVWNIQETIHMFIEGNYLKGKADNHTWFTLLFVWEFSTWASDEPSFILLHIQMWFVSAHYLSCCLLVVFILSYILTIKHKETVHVWFIITLDFVFEVWTDDM